MGVEKRSTHCWQPAVVEPPKPHIVYLEMSDAGEEQLEGLLGDFKLGHLMGLLGY